MSISLNNSTISYSNQPDGSLISATFMGEAAFTLATDKKPVVATFGCGPCVALGGFDNVNKMAFVVHFSCAEEVENFGKTLTETISKLAKEKIQLQLHLRGGWSGLSEKTIKAIREWSLLNGASIISEEILSPVDEFDSKSLFIDSRNGKIGEYYDKKSHSALFIKFFDGTLGKDIHIVYSPLL